MSMAHETLVCVERVAPERLSALRDNALPADEAQRLREHVAGCAACRARLANYDTLAAALRQQRELEPGERIVTGVRARLDATKSPLRRLRPSRRLWRGVATLAPVAAVILLFVFVLSNLAGRWRPATSLTPTASAPAATSTGKPAYPTGTPALVTLPSFTPSVSAAAAWGALTPVATYQTPQVAGWQFSLDALSPDATTLAGTQMQVIAPNASGNPAVYLISYDIATHTYKRLGPHWTGYGGEPWGGAIAIDSHYIVYSYNSGPGQTCGVCHNTIWAYDRQSGASWQVNAGKANSGSLSEVVSGGYVAFQTPQMQIWVADIATHQVTQAFNASEQANADIRLMGFSWPYLLYTYLPAAQPGVQTATTLRVRNLQTNSTLILLPPLEQTLAAQSGPGSESSVNWAAVSGDTLYFATSTNVSGVNSAGSAVNATYGTLFRVTGISARGGTPEMLARWQVNANAGAGTPALNARLVALWNGYVWDVAEGKLVQVAPDSVSTVSGVVRPGMQISGNYLLQARLVSGGNGSPLVYQGDIYDTSALPVR